MLTISSINQMIGVDHDDQHQIALNQSFLLEFQSDFMTELNAWLIEFGYQIDQVFIDDYYKNLVSGNYGQEFYSKQYAQSTYWYRSGVSLVRATLILNQCRQLLFKYTEMGGQPKLGYLISQALDIAQAVNANIYSIAGIMEGMQQKFHADVSGIERAVQFDNVRVSADLIQAYLDHVNWKVKLFSMALGDLEDEKFPHSTDDCRLGRWLNSGGWERIPRDQRALFDEAHHQVHELASQALQDAISQHPEKIIQSLSQMEKASDQVAEVLLHLIDGEIIQSATLDDLTGLPLRRVFEEEYKQFLSIARRHHFRVGLILVDVDFFKKINDQQGHLIGDKVLKKLAEVLKTSLREEDKVYRWGGEEFAVMTLGDEGNCVKVLAERIRATVEKTVFCSDSEHEMHITASCGSVCFDPLKKNSIDKMFTLADKQLYLAKQNGRNRVESLTLDAE